MKKLFLLLALVFVSCSEEDEPEVFTQADLIGTWEIYSINGNIDLNDCLNNQEAFFSENILTLTDSYSVLGICEIETEDHKYSFTNGSISFEQVLDGYAYSGKITDNKLTINIYNEGNKTTKAYIKN